MHPRPSRLSVLLVLLVVASSSLPLASAAPSDADLTAYLPRVSNYRGTPPSSLELIDAALQRGEITAETALIYKVYVIFSDTRLPARFRGDDRAVVDGDAVKLAKVQFDGLSPAAQTVLAPYLIPPIYRGSWEDPVPADGARPLAPLDCGSVTPDKWEYLDGKHARVWWKSARRRQPQPGARVHARHPGLLRCPRRLRVQDRVRLAVRGDRHVGHVMDLSQYGSGRRLLKVVFPTQQRPAAAGTQERHA